MMGIKQHGGVFGRNPTFNNVDVEGTLTVNGEPISDFGNMAQQDASAVNITGGDATLDNLTVDTNTLHVDSSNNRIGIGTLSPSSELHISDATNPSIFLEDTNGAKLRISAFNDRIQFENENIFNDMGFNLGGGETFRLDNGGDVTVSTGNLVIGTSGKGIDFSATGGSGTSELLDDYEEGTWTPVIASSNGGENIAFDVQSSEYTKIGNIVIASFDVRISSVSGGSGNAIISNLPFSSASNRGNLNVSFTSGWSSQQPEFGITLGSQNIIELRYFNSATSTSKIPWSNAVSNSRLIASARYTTF